jgi:hypothetical protein
MVCPTLETLGCELGSEELISDLENNDYWVCQTGRDALLVYEEH